MLDTLNSILSESSACGLVKSAGVKRDWINAVKSGRIKDPGLSKSLSVINTRFKVVLVPHEHQEERDSTESEI